MKEQKIRIYKLAEDIDPLNTTSSTSTTIEEQRENVSEGETRGHKFSIKFGFSCIFDIIKKSFR